MWEHDNQEVAIVPCLQLHLPLPFALAMILIFSVMTRVFMRSHLTVCLENKQLSPFPLAERQRRSRCSRLINSKIVSVYCVYRLPWNKHDRERGPLVLLEYACLLGYISMCPPFCKENYYYNFVFAFV